MEMVKRHSNGQNNAQMPRRQMMQLGLEVGCRRVTIAKSADGSHYGSRRGWRPGFSTVGRTRRE